MRFAEPSQARWSTPSDERRKYFRDFNAIPANGDKKRQRQRKYYYRHRERRLASMRMINYQCTPEAYQTMLDAQDGKCAICRSVPTARFKGRIKQLSVDHGSH